MTPEPDPYRSPASDTSEVAATSLPIAETLRATAKNLLGKRTRMAKALALPVAALVSLTGTQWAMVNRLTSGSIDGFASYSVYMMLISLLQLIVWGLLAISCHRALLEDSSGPAVVGSSWPGRRQIGYLWRAAVIGLPLVLLGSVLFVLVQTGIGFEEAADLNVALTQIALFFVLLPFQYLMARLSLVLPAAALLQPMTFGQSWRETRGMGWRLAAVLLAAPAAMTLASPLLNLAESAFFLPSYLVSYVLNLFVAIFSIAALSMSYSWFDDRGVGAASHLRTEAY